MSTHCVKDKRAMEGEESRSSLNGIASADSNMARRAKPTTVSGSGERRGSGPIPELLIRETLIPYSAKGCRYLKRASYEALDPTLSSNDAGANSDSRRLAENETAPLLRARGEFSIASSSYIQDTGHFNAAEFIMAYNQLFYCLLAQAIERGDVPELAQWTSEDFRAEQLPGIVIQRQSSEYFAPIDARNFRGEIQVLECRLIQRRHRYVRLETEVSFWDGAGAAGGYATGQFTIAVLLGERDV